MGSIRHAFRVIAQIKWWGCIYFRS